MRDLRPDVPEALSHVMLRMMAKRMENRFASFVELIEALDRIPVRDEAEPPGVALTPLDPPDSLISDVPAVRPGVRASSDPDGAESGPLSSIPEISLASLPADLVQDDPPSTFVRVVSRETAGVLPRLGGTQSLASWVGPPGAIPVRDGRQSALSTSAWITLCVALGASFVVMVILIDRFVRSSPPNSISPSFAADQPESATSEPSNGLTDPVSRTASAPVPSPREPAHLVPPVDVRAVEWPVAVAVEVEPVDVDPPAPVTAAYTEETLRKYLPEWNGTRKSISCF